MRNREILICALASLAALVSLTPAASDDLAWFRAHWEEAEAYLPPSGTSFSYTWTQSSRAGPQAVADLRVKAQRDENPRERAIATALLARAESGASTSSMRLWFDGPERWRLNKDHEPDHPAAVAPFLDRARAGRIRWRLAPQEIAITEADRPPDVGDPTAGAWRMISQELLALLRGGLSTGPLSGHEPLSARRTTRGWEAIVGGGPGGRKYRLQGIVNEEGRPETHTITLVESLDDPSSVGWVTRLEQWEYDPVLDRRIARTKSSTPPDGRATATTASSRVEIVEIGRVDPARMAALLAPPSMEHGDAERGKIETLRRAYDYRPASERVELRDGQEIRAFPLPEQFRVTGSNTVRVWSRSAWTGAGLIVAILIGVRIWRLRSTPC